ncbi:unnamed protein product [Clavelina lepadiformis]|uniref:Uncharacterized protein n=1 Tax=Clavelina lepadiformis TaxID=159417 RepID=A0ABP0FKF0_CLALP
MVVFDATLMCALILFGVAQFLKSWHEGGEGTSHVVFWLEAVAMLRLMTVRAENYCFARCVVADGTNDLQPLLQMSVFPSACRPKRHPDYVDAREIGRETSRRLSSQ